MVFSQGFSLRKPLGVAEKAERGWDFVLFEIWKGETACSEPPRLIAD
jgi:hypothetical protein